MVGSLPGVKTHMYKTRECVSQKMFSGGTKRPFSSMLDDAGSEEDRKEEQTQSTNTYAVTQQVDTEINTTNHTDDSVMVLYLVEAKYHICYYDPQMLDVQFIEPILTTNDDSEIIKALLCQFKPQELICNNKVKLTLNLSEEFLGFNLKTRVTSNKEFSYIEGEMFFSDLLRELEYKQRESSNNDSITELAEFITRLETKEDFHYYCCLMSALYLNFEMLSVDNNGYKKSDMVTAMKFVHLDEYMTLDMETMISLGIIDLGVKKEKTSNRRMTVFQLFDKCGSKVGTSLLHDYLLKPLYHIEMIQTRLDTVEAIQVEMGGNWKQSLIKQISDYIRGMPDITKVVRDLQLGNFKGSIWKQLRSFLIIAIRLKDYIESSESLIECDKFKDFVVEFDLECVRKLRQWLEDVIDFESDIDNIRIKVGYDQELDDLRHSYDRMERSLSNVSKDIGLQVGIEIVIAYIPQFGYLIAIEKEESGGTRVFSGFEQVFSTSSTTYYKNDTMTGMDLEFGDLYTLLRDKEIDILYALKNKLLNSERFNMNAVVKLYPYIGHMDVMICFAIVAKDYSLNKPKICTDEGKQIKIKGSFHPLMKNEQRDFISNDINIKEKKIMVITGPNYSGKSTILTQVGISVYLMQIGCFVPCESAELSIFKNILTRINSLDNISSSQSTFMRDCQQMSNCIYKSDERSLVLIDEFGKGTDVNDGPGLLGSIIEYFLNLHNKSPIVLLSTHMSEIFDDNMIGHNEQIDFKQMKIFLDGNDKFKITFLYQLCSGIARDSMGIYCAFKSGIDKSIVERAQSILDMINRGENIATNFASLSEDETRVIHEADEKIQKFLELNFQEWDSADAERLRIEVLKILQ